MHGKLAGRQLPTPVAPQAILRQIRLPEPEPPYPRVFALSLLGCQVLPTVFTRTLSQCKTAGLDCCICKIQEYVHGHQDPALRHLFACGYSLLLRMTHAPQTLRPALGRMKQQARD